MIRASIPGYFRARARLLLAVGLAALAAGCGSVDFVNRADLPALRAQSLGLVNAARAQEGLPPLTFDPALNKAAQAHAEDMRRRNYYSHTSLLTGGPAERYGRAGGAPIGHFAENIARCFRCAIPADSASVRQLHEQWMGSPEHRHNILKPDVTRYGFGLAETEDGKHYAVEEFYGPVRPEDYQ
ncbi:CAP domain-containing protein [Amorphus sp. 3PC139-8]|uniref:CAP domain-containing protein n=1 Tax=Amorphus sp. 3PC139-8 TaxID=2735676 RepID=UPI00345DBCD3